MRTSIFLSAALVCLSSCGEAVTALASENLVAFEGAPLMLHHDAIIDADENTGRRHLLARDEGSKLERGSLDGNTDTTVTVNDPRPHTRGAYGFDYDEGSDDSISSESSDSANGIPSHDSIESSDEYGKANLIRAPHHHYKGFKGAKLKARFKFKHQTRSQTLAKIDKIKNEGGDDDSLEEEDAYLGLLDDRCTLPQYKEELACAQA
uniref:RxLR effector protein n=1 Tax=Peronospora matthiolae TaxID=2874970 RepID=A0AAV1URH0_9STRA